MSGRVIDTLPVFAALAAPAGDIALNTLEAYLLTNEDVLEPEEIEDLKAQIKYVKTPEKGDLAVSVLVHNSAQAVVVAGINHKGQRFYFSFHTQSSYLLFSDSAL